MRLSLFQFFSPHDVPTGSQNQLNDAYDNLKEYKRLIEQYRGEIEQMRHVLEAVNQDNMSHIVPKL